MTGYIKGDDPHPGYIMSEAKDWAIGLGILFVLVGAIGGAIWAGPGADETIQIEGKPEKTVEFYLEKLRSKARVKNFQ